MRIVTQDGRRSIDFDGATIGITTPEQLDGYDIIAVLPGVPEIVNLGNYGLDRADEVFSEIHEAYELEWKTDKRRIYYMPEE